MRHEVAVLRSGMYTYCETVGELAKALDVSTKTVSADGANGCLCNAYLGKLGARRATDEEGWPFPAYVIEVQ